MTEAVTTREITITRIFDAPRELVWESWVDPRRLARWWGKRGWNTPLESITLDVRPGGSFRLNSISEETGEEMPREYVFHEVVAPERLVFGEPGRADGHDSATTVTFTDLGDGRTEMVLRGTILTTAEIRDRALAGLSSAFDRLAEQLLQETRPTP
jgi:uncharacterized protein YndB with AHSA1/START domain